MSPLTAAIVSGMICGSVMYLVAWRLHGAQHMSTEDIVAYMDRKVTMEEMEAQEHRLRTIALRANRLAMPNLNSGPPARVSRMTVGPKEFRETFFKQK